MDITLIPFSDMHIGSPSLLKVRTKAITIIPGTPRASNIFENKYKKVFVCLFYRDTKVKDWKELLRHSAHIWQGQRRSAFSIPTPTSPTPSFPISAYPNNRHPVEIPLYSLVEHLNSHSKLFFVLFGWTSSACTNVWFICLWGLCVCVRGFI